MSADTLVYFGDLEPVLAAAAGALRPNGLFVFTLEHAAGDDAASTTVWSGTAATATPGHTPSGS